MPFLRAALIPHKEPERIRRKPKRRIRSVEDMWIALVAKAWNDAIDRATRREIARLGL